MDEMTLTDEDFEAGVRRELQSAEDALRTLRSQRDNPGNAPIYDQLDTKISWHEGLVRELRECLH